MDNQITYKLEGATIDKVYKSDKSQEGKPYVSSKGNPFTKVDIYVDARLIQDPDFQGKMTFFDYYGQSINWEIGTTLSGTVVKNGRYFNFNLPPSGKKALDLDIKELQDRVKRLEDKVFNVIGQSQEVNEALDMTKEMLSEDEITDDDLPF